MPLDLLSTIVVRLSNQAVTSEPMVTPEGLVLLGPPRLQVFPDKKVLLPQWVIPMMMLLFFVR